MPSNHAVNSFCDLVVAGRFIEAIDEFYAPSVEVRENLAPARVGRDEHLAHERQVLSKVRIKAERIGPVLIEGDRAAIHWRFEMTAADGRTSFLDEIAWQVWEGDRIASEQFFYDPGQLTVFAEART